MTRSQHHVRIIIKLSDDDFGEDDERDRWFDFEAELAGTVESDSVGEWDGNEIGGGYFAIFFYGPDADSFFFALQSKLSGLPAGSHALIRRGDNDAAARWIQLG